MNLKEYCAKNGISLKSISEEFGMAYSHFAACSRGQRRFGIDLARKISEYCNGEVTIDDLVPPRQETEKCPLAICKKTLSKQYCKITDKMPKKTREKYLHLIKETNELLKPYMD